MRSTNRTFTLAFAIVLTSSCLATAQGAAAPAPPDPSKAILQYTQRFESNLMALAQAMPADKYNFAPSAEVFKAGSPAKFDTVRTFAQQLTHVADYSFRNFAPFGGAFPTDIDMKNLNNITSKDEVIKVLQASFDYQNKCIATLTAENALSPQGPRGATLVSALLAVLNDDGDHYGQLVEYGRMNGIVPPATERTMQNAAPPPQK